MWKQQADRRATSSAAGWPGNVCQCAEQAYLYVWTLHHDGVPERGSQLVLLIVLQHTP